MKTDFDDLLKTMSVAEADRVRGYYLLDENQLNQERSPAPEYVLQEATISSGIERVADHLSRILRDAAKQLWPDEVLSNPMR